MSRHFYLEEVFDDSTSDKPNFRWRYRSFFDDNITYDQNTSGAATESGSGRRNQLSHDSGAHGNPQNRPQISSSDFPGSYGTGETKQDIKQSPVSGIH